jgi:Glu-tRNA(Gln) amidotransferase subunit E-like FAD-binding protein
VNALFEPLRGTWVAHDREVAEDQRNYIRKFSDQIPVEISQTLLAIITYTETSEQCCDLWNDQAIKASFRQVHENMFYEEQIKGLLKTIRATKDADSIRRLLEEARDVIERIKEFKYKQEQERRKRSFLTVHSRY